MLLFFSLSGIFQNIPDSLKVFHPPVLFQICGDLTEDVASTSQWPAELPTNVTLTCSALKWAHAARLMVIVETQQLTVPIRPAWTIATPQVYCDSS